MTEEQTAAAFQAALEDSLRRIQRHQKRVSDEVGQLLGDIGDRLFEPDFGVDELRRLCPPGSSTRTQLLVERGLEPEAYLEQRRFDIARFLVCKTCVRVGLIAQRLGFREPKLFSKWFERRSGMAPEKLRAAQPCAAEPSKPAPVSRKSWVSERIWHQSLLGVAGSEQVADLLRALRGLYPGAVSDES